MPKREGQPKEPDDFPQFKKPKLSNVTPINQEQVEYVAPQQSKYIFYIYSNIIYYLY